MNGFITPLHWAAERGDVKTLVSLAKKKEYGINVKGGVCL